MQRERSGQFSCCKIPTIIFCPSSNKGNKSNKQESERDRLPHLSFIGRRNGRGRRTMGKNQAKRQWRLLVGRPASLAT